MGRVATTTLSSRGQVVIPEDVRTRMGLEPGVQFVVLGEGDVVVLKILHTPQLGEFRDIVSRARGEARGFTTGEQPTKG